MTDRTETETPQFVVFMPWRIRIAIAVAFLVVMTLAFASMPEGPWHLTTAPIYLVGFTAYSFAVHRSVIVRLQDHAVDIRQSWRNVRIPYEDITEVAIGPRTPWWQIGRRRMADGVTGYLMGGPSVRISTGETSVVVSAEESYRVAGAIDRQCARVVESQASNPEQTGR